MLLNSSWYRIVADGTTATEYYSSKVCRSSHNKVESYKFFSIMAAQTAAHAMGSSTSIRVHLFQTPLTWKKVCLYSDVSWLYYTSRVFGTVKCVLFIRQQLWRWEPVYSISMQSSFVAVFHVSQISCRTYSLAGQTLSIQVSLAHKNMRDHLNSLSYFGACPEAVKPTHSGISWLYIEIRDP